MVESVEGSQLVPNHVCSPILIYTHREETIESHSGSHHEVGAIVVGTLAVGKKKVEVPAVKVATGVLATSELYKQALMNAGGCIATDSFQRVRAQRVEANIKFLVRLRWTSG